MTDNDSKQQMIRCVDKAVAKIEDAMGWLDDAARLAGGPVSGQLYQVTYALDQAIRQARDAASDVRP